MKKTTPAAPAPTPAQASIETAVAEQVDDSMDEDGEGRKKRFFFPAGPRKLTPIQKREKKMKQNRRLRKLLCPKNAVVALNELKGSDKGEYVVTGDKGVFKAEVVVNNVKYEAIGQTKAAAKMKVSEKALRDLVITQMAKVQASKKSDGEEGDGDVDMENLADNEDVPMTHLASFALHKLFTEWQEEGFEIPDYKTGKTISDAANNASESAAASTENGTKPATATRAIPKVAKTIADLPADAGSRHPAALLALMRPQAVYADLGVNGIPPNTEYTMGVTVDEKQYLGKAKNKKFARKAAAMEACSKLWGVIFDDAMKALS